MGARSPMFDLCPVHGVSGSNHPRRHSIRVQTHPTEAQVRSFRPPWRFAWLEAKMTLNFVMGASVP